MAKQRQYGAEKIRVTTVILFVCFASCVFFYPRFVSTTFGSEAVEATPEQTPRRRTTRRRQPAGTQRSARYSAFPHNIAQHQQACTTCHKFPTENWKEVRKTDPFPDVTDFPQHESCINCHRQQFFRGRPPVICSICHTNPSPRNEVRHPFPNPRETFDQTARGRQAVSDFEIFFPHDKHIEIVSQNESGAGEFVKASYNWNRQEASCAVCHKTYQPQGDSDDEYFTKPPAKLGDAFWLKKGTFKTSPISHASCFSCHSEESGLKPAPTDCATCHKPAQTALKADFDPALFRRMGIYDRMVFTSWRSRFSSGTFRHEFPSHADLECATCHNAAAMNTLDERTERVSLTSCSTCHVTATSDDGGALNFEVDARKANPKFQCVKCHVSHGSSPIPESHLKAIAAAAGN